MSSKKFLLCKLLNKLLNVIKKHYNTEMIDPVDFYHKPSNIDDCRTNVEIALNAL